VATPLKVQAWSTMLTHTYIHRESFCRYIALKLRFKPECSKIIITFHNSFSYILMYDIDLKWKGTWHCRLSSLMAAMCSPNQCAGSSALIQLFCSYYPHHTCSILGLKLLVLHLVWVVFHGQHVLSQARMAWSSHTCVTFTPPPSKVSVVRRLLHLIVYHVTLVFFA
jgi:hypothetical protein